MDERRKVGGPDTNPDAPGARGPTRPTGPSILEARARGLQDSQLLPEWHEPLVMHEPLEGTSANSLIGGLLGLEGAGLPPGWLRAGDLIAVGSLIAGCTLSALTLGPAGILLTMAMEAMAAAGGALVAQELERPAPPPSDELPDEATTLAILDEELHKARRNRSLLAVLLVAPDCPADLDVLRHIAERAASSLRDEDTLGRQGRERLLIVLPGYGASLGSLVAQRIRLVTPPEVTVSVGLASTDLAPTADLPELVKMAAQALYRASKRGGNSVVVARLPRS